MKSVALLIPLFLLIGCTKDEEVDIQETAQQIGDVMASVDESGGTSNGTMAMMESHQRFIATREKSTIPAPLQFLNSLGLIPSAQAVACKDTTFSACTASEKVRNLSGCTINSATFTGDVTLQFSDAACVLDSLNDTVDREPNFTVTGRRGAVLTVSKVGNGQRITRGATASDFTFSNDGIRRVFSLAGQTLFDYTTETTSDITVTGSSRSDRVMSGGQLRITNNESGVTCDYAPSNVTWTSSCNCATSGSWAGSCSDGKTTSIVVTGCGTGSITIGEDSETLSFDRCYSTN